MKLYQKCPNFQAASLKLAITSEPKVQFNSNKNILKQRLCVFVYCAIISLLMIKHNFTFQTVNPP